MIFCTSHSSNVGPAVFFAGDIKIWLTDCSEPAMLLGYVRAVWQYAWHHKGLVSEPDSQKIGKEGLVNGTGMEVYTFEFYYLLSL